MWSNRRSYEYFIRDSLIAFRGKPAALSNHLCTVCQSVGQCVVRAVNMVMNCSYVIVEMRSEKNQWLCQITYPLYVSQSVSVSLELSTWSWTVGQSSRSVACAEAPSPLFRKTYDNVCSSNETLTDSKMQLNYHVWSVHTNVRFITYWLIDWQTD